MEGYIKLFRNMLEWRWFRDPSVAHLFTYLLLRVNYSDAEWKGITIRRGQLITSRNTLAHETGLTEKVVRRCLTTLVRTGEISVRTTSQYSLITICKYAEYQGGRDAVDQEGASKRPAMGQQTAINNKERESNNKEASLRSDSLSVHAPTKSDEKIDYQAFIAFFNQTMTGKVIPQISRLTKKRQGMLNARVREYGKDSVVMVVRKAANSCWLNGGGGQFVANFDWLFSPANFIKVLEGNYDDRASSQSSIEYSSSPVQSNFKFSSYEEHRYNEQKKRLDSYAEAVDETLNRG